VKSAGMSHAPREVDRYGGVRAAGARPRRARVSRISRGYARVAALLVCLAAIVIISSIALAPMGKGNATADRGEVLVRQPLPPHSVQGYVYEADGVTPVGPTNCVVNITNQRTGDWNLTGVDEYGYGWYEFDMNMFANGVLDGDPINVTVTRDADIGWAQGLAATPTLDMNIVLGPAIPEFPLVVLPVVGMIAVFALVSLRSRKDGAQ